MSHKPVILTGLRANNNLHIGNYFGAMLPMVDMAKRQSDKYQFNFFVPDLHSFTTPIEHGSLYESSLMNLRMYVAAGLPLDREGVYIYRQSFIPAHSELTWILSCFTGFGEMRRMTQFKEKMKQPSSLTLNQIAEGDEQLRDLLRVYEKVEQAVDEDIAKELYEKLGESIFEKIKLYYTDEASVGLFSYPILMAADILLHDGEYVPVGDDQTQHLEFTRDIAERMNNRFGELFKAPHPVKQQHKFFGKDQGLRIRDLIDPTKKMSKSDDTGKGVIFLNDEPEVAIKKIKSATTDSLGEIQYDYEAQPGISNLLDILKLLGGRPEDYIGQQQYGPLKEEVAKRVGQLLKDFQSSLEAVEQSTLEQHLALSEDTLNQTAQQKLHAVQVALGLRS